MSRNADLKALEKKAWQSVFEDGLWDIYLGILLLSFAVSAWIDKQPMEESLRTGLYISVMVLAMIVLYAGKRFITIPRVGRVRFGAERQRRRNVVRLVLFASVLAGFLLWWLGGALLGGGGELFPLIWVLNMAFVFGLGAYFLDYARLYLIGLLYALVIPLDVYLKKTTGIDWDIYIFSAAGAIVLLMGVFYLLRFVREHHPVDAGDYV